MFLDCRVGKFNRYIVINRIVSILFLVEVRGGLENLGYGFFEFWNWGFFRCFFVLFFWMGFLCFLSLGCFGINFCELGVIIIGILLIRGGFREVRFYFFFIVL